MKYIFKFNTFWLLLILLMFSIQIIEAKNLVYDSAGFLSPADRIELNNRLNQIEKNTSVEIAFISVPSLYGYDIREVSKTKGKDLSIGKKGVNNGVMIFIAPSERKLIINLGVGIQWLISDTLNKTYVDTLIMYFMRNKKLEGISRIAEIIISKVKDYSWKVNEVAVEELDNLGKYSGQIISFPYTSKIREIRYIEDATKQIFAYYFISIHINEKTVRLYYSTKMLSLIESLNDNNLTVYARVRKSNPLYIDLLGVD